MPLKRSPGFNRSPLANFSMLIITARLPPQSLGLPRLTCSENLFPIFGSRLRDHFQQPLKTGHLSRRLESFHFFLKITRAYFWLAHSPNASLINSSALSVGTAISKTWLRVAFMMWEEDSAASDSLFALS